MFREEYHSIAEYSEFLFYWLGLETIMGIVGNINLRVAISVIIFVQGLVSQQPGYLNKFIQQRGLANKIKIGSSVISVLKVIFAQDPDQVNSINKLRRR